jgi:hypothetical protein
LSPYQARWMPITRKIHKTHLKHYIRCGGGKWRTVQEWLDLECIRIEETGCKARLNHARMRYWLEVQD